MSRLLTWTRSLSKRALGAAAGVALLAATSSAHFAFYFTFHADGTQVVPGTASPATADGYMVFDGLSYTITYSITITGLTGAETAAELHGFAPAGVNAPLLYTFPLGSQISGVIQAQFSDLSNFLNDVAYFQIASDAFPGGELRGQILTTATPPEELFCVGDGAAACPCGNNSATGTYSGCAHSLGYGGIARAHNIASVSCDTLKIHALTLPMTAPALFFSGTTKVNGGAGAPFGDGLRCVGGSVIRLGTKSAVNGATFYPDVGDTPITIKCNITVPGTVRYYQVWFRNAVNFCTSATYNLTNGTGVTWVP